jgi:hypothetical protein
LKNNFKFQAKPFNSTLDMKKIFAILASVIAVASSSQAALITSNQTQNLTRSGADFTFSQFNTNNGTLTLTAIDLIIQSSTLQGNLTYVRTSLSNAFSNLNAGLSIAPTAGLDDGYATEGIVYARTPSGNFSLNATNTSQLITVNGTTQSLIGGSPLTVNLSSSGFGSYLGTETVTFNLALFAAATATGSGTYNINSPNLLAPTTLSLQYTYTDTSTVPEPSQVAASLLVVGGLGIYLLRRRRKVAAL